MGCKRSEEERRAPEPSGEPTRYEVVSKGRVRFSSPVKETADAVAGQYPGSEVVSTSGPAPAIHNG